MLRFYESDGETPLSQLAFGKVGPGESYFEKNAGYLEIVVKNDGAVTITDVVVEILQVGTFVAYQFARIATGEGEPGAFSEYDDEPLALGSLEADESAVVFVDLVVPSYATRGLGQFLQLRASGDEA